MASALGHLVVATWALYGCTSGVLGMRAESFDGAFQEELEHLASLEAAAAEATAEAVHATAEGIVETAAEGLEDLAIGEVAAEAVPETKPRLEEAAEELEEMAAQDAEGVQATEAKSQEPATELGQLDAQDIVAASGHATAPRIQAVTEELEQLAAQEAVVKDAPPPQGQPSSSSSSRPNASATSAKVREPFTELADLEPRRRGEHAARRTGAWQLFLQKHLTLVLDALCIVVAILVGVGAWTLRPGRASAKPAVSLAKWTDRMVAARNPEAVKAQYGLGGPKLAGL